jgi:hypothetical protein
MLMVIYHIACGKREEGFLGLREDMIDIRSFLVYKNNWIAIVEFTHIVY